jgi:excisionase family DNA binding protein
MSTNIKVQRICQYCGNEFTARTTTTLYCSHKCNGKAYKAKERDAKVEESNKETIQLITKSIEELKVKPFLSIAECCVLLGISRRTVYRMLDRGELIAGKAGKRTILRRSDLDNLFPHSKPTSHISQADSKIEPLKYDISECYNLTEVQNKYGISEKALHELIKRNGIPKFKEGWFAYVPKNLIDNLLT